jgi:hypothetical protein
MYYYAKKPTENAPATALVGPYKSRKSAEQGLVQAITETEQDTPGKNFWGEYLVFQLVGTVQPVITQKVSLQSK